MNSKLLYFSVFLFGFSSFTESPSDFDNQLSEIANSFRQEIMYEKQCVELREQTLSLYYQIRDAESETYKYSADEIKSLMNLEKEAEALEEYIRAVGHCFRDEPFSINKFKLANRRVGGITESIVTGKFCVDVISVTIDNYTTYLVQNQSSKRYKVDYYWKAANGMNSGSGNFLLLENSVRHIYDNRKIPALKKIIVYKISCIEQENTLPF